MRTSSRGVALQSAFMSMAVLGSEGRAHAAQEKLERAGLVIVTDLALKQQRRIEGTVLHAVRTADLDEATEIAASAHATEARQASFQPIWAIWPSFRALGFELHVIDDDDAIEQLDTFHEALKDDSMLKDTKRSHITISPRGGWNGYGHPQVTLRG